MDIEDLEKKLYNLADEQYSKKANAYLLNKFILLGIYTPQRKEIIKPFLLEKLTREYLIELVNQLWNHKYRDFKYVAISFLKKNQNLLEEEDLIWIKSLALVDSWWDSIDSLAPIVGFIIKTKKLNTMDNWIQDKNFWIRRIAIIHQLGWKEDTNVERLAKYALSQAEEGEFFIRKAIGWAFRDYARNNPVFVWNFMQENKTKFSKLSYKEATKHLNFSEHYKAG